MATTPTPRARRVTLIKQATTARTDPRRDRTRDALLQAGRTLFARRDVDGVSVDEIVDAAAVAKGSFYNHFADKDAFAREIASAARREVELLVNQANAGIDDPALGMARALCVFTRFAMEHRESARTLWRLNTGATMVDAPINRDLTDVVRQGIERGVFKHVVVESGVLLVMGIIVITLRHLFEDRIQTQPRKIARDMAAGLLRSLGIPATRAEKLASDAARAVLG
jgi:AcrR family transcriptional regulator